uniref:Uncharacterized protein n=1 Tax=Arundo donax TaxID=35708 RepID=A0A0A9G1B8_ARUDO
MGFTEMPTNNFVESRCVFFYYLHPTKTTITIPYLQMVLLQLMMLCYTQQEIQRSTCYFSVLLVILVMFLGTSVRQLDVTI